MRPTQNSVKVDVHVTLRCYVDGEVCITVEDEGQGLTVVQYRTRLRAVTGSALMGGNLPDASVNGRGLVRTNGKVVRMRKRLTKPLATDQAC